MKKLTLFFISFCFFLSCKKNDTAPTNSVFGKWAFKTQISGVFQYPYPYPEIYWGQSLQPVAVNYYDNDSVSLNLNNDGSFSGFIPSYSYHITGGGNIYVPAVSYSGTFTKSNDSTLLIYPDTSYLLTYTYMEKESSPFPNHNTVYFKQPTSDSLTFIQSWLIDSTLNVSMSGLKRR